MADEDEVALRAMFDDVDAGLDGQITRAQFGTLCRKLEPDMEDDEITQALAKLDPANADAIKYDGAPRRRLGAPPPPSPAPWRR